MTLCCYCSLDLANYNDAVLSDSANSIVFSFLICILISVSFFLFYKSSPSVLLCFVVIFPLLCTLLHLFCISLIRLTWFQNHSTLIQV